MAEELAERVEAAGLGSVVEGRGEPSPQSIPGRIAAADVCLAPATGFLAAGLCELPQPILEHLACYRPVVAANVPGVSEIVRDEAEGLLVPPRDAAALADAVLEVLRDAVLRERLTDAGYRRARDELSAGARRRRIRQVYESIAPSSQLLDPWRDNFEEVTGLIELSTGAIEELQGPSTQEMPAAPRPTAEKLRPRLRREDHRSAASDGRPTAVEARSAGAEAGRRHERGDQYDPPTLDTQPGLVLPDTDPGDA
jgi:hypothetical protein